MYSEFDSSSKTYVFPTARDRRRNVYVYAIMLTGAMLLILCVWPGFSDYPKHVMSNTPEPPQISTEVEIWSGITIDLDTEVSPTELQPGDLTSSNVEPDFSVAEAAGDVSVIFTTSNPLPADGKIVITFPSGFRLNSGSDTVMGDDGASFDGTTSVAVSGQIATIQKHNPQHDFYVINVGSDLGLKKGDKFNILRNGQAVGRIEITRAQPVMSIATTDRAFPRPQMPFKPGDQVIDANQP